jgi:hypothetical protein
MANTALPRFGDAKLDLLINQLEISLNDLEGAPLAGAVILPRQLVGASDTRIFHGLGRPVAGYWIVGSNVDVRVADGAVPEAIDPRNYFTLRASTAAVLGLAVF